MERAPLDKHTFLLKNTDAVMDRTEAGGFEGWLGRMQAARPHAIFLARFRPTKFSQRERHQKMTGWLKSEYVRMKICIAAQKGTLYVRADLAAQFRAQTAPGDCFTP
jgi:hypothetical protein